jgi:hypothetical protein
LKGKKAMIPVVVVDHANKVPTRKLIEIHSGKENGSK